jgi:hypothetical protein
MRCRGLVRALAMLACVAAVGVAPACGLALDGLGAATPDASTGSVDAGDAMTPAEGGSGDDGGPNDGPADAASTGDGAAGPVTITSVGAITQPTGLAQETHLLYATASARWWLFWIEDAQPYELQASSSVDFTTWTAATPLALPGSLDEQGGDFSVTYANIAGVDVVHISLDLRFPDVDAGPDRRHYHARASLSGGAILYDAPVEMTMITDPAIIEPDGPATIVTSDHRVWDSSGWANYMGTGNEVAWQSEGFENGTSWDGMMGAAQPIAAEATTVNARAFAVAGGSLVALWELADQEPDPTNVAWSQNGILGWGTPANVFASNPQSANDWDVIEVSANDLRVVRRALDGSFDHLSYDGTTWTTLAAPPSDPGLAEAGLVLLTDGTRVAIVTIANDGASSIRMIEWDGSAWGAWSTLEGSTATRRYVSAWSSPGHNAVMWTQQTPSLEVDIVGMLVSL